MAGATDLDGNARIVGGRVDMGAYEVQPPYANYVALTGSDANGGTSWADAYLTITQGVAQAKAAIAGGEADALVNVGTGTFEVAVEVLLDQPIALAGQGHTGDQSILRQTNNVRLMILSHSSACLDGLVLENGYITTSGQGANAYMSDGTITNCVIRNNRYYLRTGGTGWSGKQQGGGLYMTGGLVVDSEITGCGIGHYRRSGSYTYSQGGGVYITGGTLRRTVVANNHIRVPVCDQGQQARGAGIYLGGAGVVENCLIRENYGYPGSTGGSTHREQHQGAGVYLAAGTLRSSTIASNSYASAGGANGGYRRGGGVYGAGGDMVNCIVWTNQVRAGDLGTNYYHSASAVSYSCAPELTSGTGNITSDPLFEDPASADYHLRRTSPCIDAGTNQTYVLMAGATDLDGNARIVGGRVDMGAYELPPPAATVLWVR
jgi:hypothetical protein